MSPLQNGVILSFKSYIDVVILLLIGYKVTSDKKIYVF